MWWKWSDRAQPRPNKRVHPFDAYEMPKRLRGDVDEPEDHSEATIVWAFAMVLVWGFVAVLFMVTA